ncbi:methylmalonyl Co-A mutase-associated GTPase MeaB [Pseudogracilibacillus sp. ICA-222130]|uniref:methylmalonyl Co-A mutase-associated GTPase MeaB n=1 Tax=Pseudogracilibacillus sp. ICA-222130 TaxID=3134655 RepID=UPI0030BCDE37
MSHKKNEDKSHKKDSALHVMGGIHSSHDGMKRKKRRRFVKKETSVNIDSLFDSIAAGSRNDLARGITLIESMKRSDHDLAQNLLQKALPHTGESVRIGVSGVPGAGKSTFIETFGLMLADKGHKVAVLAIDPSSAVSGGSILGDKTRMEKLTNHPNAFIRPSPTSGTLGGVHRKTRETMLLCEAAGFDIILIETVGVGQSEIAVRNMVDFFAMVAITGAGDDLQGMKKGIMEITDLIIVHKADGDNVRRAKRTAREFKQILHYLQPATPGWLSTAIPVSSYEKTGHEEVWETIHDFREKVMETGYWDDRRKNQVKNWFHDMIYEELVEQFFRRDGVKEKVAQLEAKILADELPVTKAMELLFQEE